MFIWYSRIIEPDKYVLGDTTNCVANFSGLNIGGWGGQKWQNGTNLDPFYIVWKLVPDSKCVTHPTPLSSLGYKSSGIYIFHTVHDSIHMIV